MRVFISSLLALMVVAAPTFSFPRPDDKVKMDDEVKKATAKALEWLASKQVLPMARSATRGLSGQHGRHRLRHVGVHVPRSRA